MTAEEASKYCTLSHDDLAAEACEQCLRIREACAAERDACLSIVQSEEELPGPMPDENWVMSQRVRLEAHLRATVLTTKRNIISRIRETRS